VTSYTLVEREKLGWPDGRGNGGAYKVGEVQDAGHDQAAAYAGLVAEVAHYPRRYGPFGTHTLVLLAVTP
jgi:hypothetical protein